MTGQQLKNSILQMAIQGKLVPQDPRDEPASILLERIREEKKRLVKEGVLKKKDLEEKTISEEEVLFDIPDSWEWIRFGTIANCILGKMLDKANNKGIPKPYLRNINIRWGSIDFTDILMMPVTNEEEIKLSLLENDLLLCEGGEPGRCAVWKKEYPAVLFQKALHRARFYLNINPYYIAKVIELFANLNLLSPYITGSTIKHLPGQGLVLVPIPLPPLADQRRIVEKLESLMPLIERYGKSQEALNALNASLPEKLRQSILQEAIQGHLVPQDPNEEPASVLLERIRAEKARLVKEGKLKKKDLEEKPISPDEIPFDIPEGWVWCRLTDIASNSLGKTLNGGKTTGQIKTYLCTINVYWNNIDLSNLKSTAFSENDCVKYRVNPGDLLICEGGDYGRCAVWDIDKEMYYQNALHRVSFYCNVNPYFFMYYIQYCKSAKILDELAKGMTIKHLTQDALYSMFFPLPPLSEQRRIVTKLEELLQEIDKLKA